MALVCAQDEANSHLINRVKSPFILPGQGDRDEPPSFFCFQRIVQRWVALKYSYDFPYEIMEAIETKRVTWCEEVWDFMYMPRLYRNQTYPYLWQQSQAIKKN